MDRPPATRMITANDIPLHAIAVCPLAARRFTAINGSKRSSPNTLPSSPTKKAVKLPKYNDETQLEPYLSQVQLAAWHGGWNDKEMAIHVALALGGKALQALLDLAPAEQWDLQALMLVLERQFWQCITPTRTGNSWPAVAMGREKVWEPSLLTSSCKPSPNSTQQLKKSLLPMPSCRGSPRSGCVNMFASRCPVP